MIASCCIAMWMQVRDSHADLATVRIKKPIQYHQTSSLHRDWGLGMRLSVCHVSHVIAISAVLTERPAKYFS
jgi:hypothetical protein